MKKLLLITICMLCISLCQAQKNDIHPLQKEADSLIQIHQPKKAIEKLTLLTKNTDSKRGSSKKSSW